MAQVVERTGISTNSAALLHSMAKYFCGQLGYLQYEYGLACKTMEVSFSLFLQPRVGR